MYISSLQLSNDEVHIEVNSNSVQSTASELSHDQELQRSIPVVEKHYKPHPPRTSLATHLYVAPGNQAGIERRAVLGMSGRGRGNIVWQASTGQLEPIHMCMYMHLHMDIGTLE